MLDQKMHALASHVEDGVPLPDLAGLVDRGVALRRRRGAAVAVAASCLLAVGYLATFDRTPDTEPSPAIEPESTASHYPGGMHTPDLSAGTYAIRLGTDRGEALAEVTVPDGWTGWVGPNRDYRRGGYVSLVVQDVAYVVETPCRMGIEGMAAVGDAPGDLVGALTRIPRHDLVVAPEPDSRFGVPATHLVLQASERVDCPGRLYFGLWSPGAAIPIWSLGPGATLELWVLDVDGEAVLVAATSTPGTPTHGMRELAEVTASVEIIH